jgi:HK97 family phage major capsid protein
MTEPVDLHRWVRSGPLSRPGRSGAPQERRPVAPPANFNQPTRRPQRSAAIASALDDMRRGLEMVREVQQKRRARFPSLTANLRAIRDAAGRAPREWDDRLQRAPSGSYEGDAATGGFLVQADFAAPVIGSVYSEHGSGLAAMADLVVVDGGIGARKFPAIDEVSRVDGSRWGGLISYWSTEADEVSPSFPRFRNLDLSPKKVIAAVKCSNELLEDSSLFEAFVTRALPAELGFRIDRAILFGTGAGQPLGIVNAPATVVAPAETGQASGTITAANVQSMYSRLPLTSRRTAAWLVGEDAERQLTALANSDGGSTALQYVPAGLVGNKVPLLGGLPVITLEQAAPLGTLGDIILADMAQYIILQFPLQSAMSADVAFLTDETVFRFTLRLDGAPIYASPVTPANGGSTRSPFVALAAR